MFFCYDFFGKQYKIKDNVEKRFPVILGLDNKIKISRSKSVNENKRIFGK